MPITSLETLPETFLNELKDVLGGKFDLAGVIARGKNGIALLVSAPNNSERYCLKTPLPELGSESEFRDAKEKLEKEVRILEPLDHRCLPKIIFSDFSVSRPYYVCTFHPGDTFYQFRRQEKVLEIEQSLFIIHSILDTFEYLHKNGRSHCDAHQDNILIGDNVFAQGIMLIDFGSGHRGSDEKQDTPDRGAILFKDPAAQARHQRSVSRVKATPDFERYDFKAVGVLLAVMREIFFADASLRQLEEYDDFCADLQSGTIKSWSTARERLKFVANPSYLQSRIHHYLDDTSATSLAINIPTHVPRRIGPAFEELVDTVALQKLRGIKQLSFCDWEYFGGVHTRFEHSLGVFETAAEGIEHLCRVKSFRRHFSEIHVLSLLLGSLLHDVGHYPFAHVIEHYVAARLGDNRELRDHVHHARHSIDLVKNDAQIRRIIVDRFSEEHLSEIANILGGQRGFLSRLLDSPARRAPERACYLSARPRKCWRSMRQRWVRVD